MFTYPPAPSLGPPGESAKINNRSIILLEDVQSVIGMFTYQVLVRGMRHAIGLPSSQVHNGRSTSVDSAEMEFDIADSLWFLINNGKSRRRCIGSIDDTAVSSGKIMVTSISIPSDDIKGRIIGREGRNIRTFEQSHNHLR